MKKIFNSMIFVLILLVGITLFANYDKGKPDNTPTESVPAIDKNIRDQSSAKTVNYGSDAVDVKTVTPYLCVQYSNQFGHSVSTESQQIDRVQVMTEIQHGLKIVNQAFMILLIAGGIVLFVLEVKEK